jgi:hypothetical protein
MSQISKGKVLDAAELSYDSDTGNSSRSVPIGPLRPAMEARSGT